MKLKSKPIVSGRIMMLIVSFVFLWSASSAEAAITCTSITNSTINTAYSGTAPNITQGSFTVTCNRNAAGDPLTLNFTVSVNNGLHRTGSQNRAQLGFTTNRILYETYQNNTCSTLWGNGGGAGPTISGTINFANNFVSTTSSLLYFWGCITAAGQAVPAGTYTDTVTMTLSCCGAPTGSISVSITNPASCSLATSPGNVAFTYTSFQLAAATANTTFGVNCTSLLPYTVALDAYSGTLPATGLTYTLTVRNSLSATVLSSTVLRGTGVIQTYTIDGSMAGGQSGTCALASCPDAQARTLTITY